MVPFITVVIEFDGNLVRLQEFITTLKEQTYPNLEFVLYNQSLLSKEEISHSCPFFSGNIANDSKELLTYLQAKDSEYLTICHYSDTLFNVAIEKLYHAAALTEASFVMGNYADFIDGQFYFYPWGDDCFLRSLSQSEYLQAVATSNVQQKQLFSSVYGKLFHRCLFEKLSDWNTFELSWRMSLEVTDVVYVNYPSYIYTPRTQTLKSYYQQELSSFQYLMKESQEVPGFSLEEAKRHYKQELANFTEWLKNEGATKDSKRVYNMLVAAEIGIIPILDLPSLDFTIISNNCVGGLIYEQMGLPFLTPFAGLFISPEDYYKLTKNLRYYMDQELIFDKDFYRFANTDQYYPVGYLADVTLHFLHYKSIEDAREKWYRRKSRMNWKNIYFKFDNRDGASLELLKQMDELPYHNKMILVHRHYPELENECIVPGCEGFSEVGIINYPIQTFDVVGWLQKGGNDLK